MAALSAVVFSLSWWLGLYLLARDPRKPVLVLAAIGLTSFASVVALDAVRVVSGLGRAQQHRDLSGRRARHRLVRGAARAVPAARHLAQPGRRDRARGRRGGGRVLRRGDGRQRRRPAAAGPLGDVRGDLAVVAGRDAARRCSVRGSRGRWWATSWSPRCSSRWATRSWSSRSGWCRAGWRWRPPDSTSHCSASRSRCGMRSTRARRCAPTCCARSRRRPWWRCCSAGRR